LVLSGPVAAQPCSINLGLDRTICQGQTTTITAPAGFPNYLWSTGSSASSITVGTAGTYWGQASYPSGNLAVNGNFSAGNTGFSTQFNYNTDLVPDGNYFIANNAAAHHSQFIGAGNGPFLMINAGWQQPGWSFWCQTVPVCPGQTYTLSYRGVTLAPQNPPLLTLFVNNDWTFQDHTLGPLQNQWQTFNTAWTAPAGITSAEFCLKVSSGWGIGNDFGIDDITIQSTITMRDDVEVFVTPLPVVDLGPNVTLCVGQNLTLDAGVVGGTYVWQDGSTGSTYQVSGPGIYSVTVTANSCSVTDAITVGYNPVPVLDLGPDITLCTGQNLVLNATVPGGSYGWQDGSSSATFNVTGPGSYSVNVSANGCSTSDQIEIAYNPTPVFDIGSDQTICAGDQVVLDATTAGATYLWQDGSTGPTFTATTNGAYDATVTLNGCPANDLVNLTFTPLPVVELGPDQTICPGDAVLLDATVLGGAYVWQDGSTNATFNATTAGNYTVDVTADGCTRSDSFTLALFNLQTVDLGPDVVFCQGGSASIGATVPGASYAWSSGESSSSITVTSAGIRWLDVTLNGCTVRDSILVSMTPLPVVDLGPDRLVCPGEQALIDATTPGATYLWNTGAAAPTINVPNGNYDVTITVNGCDATDAVLVTNHPTPVVDLGADVSLCPGTQLVLDAEQPGASYVWQDGSMASTFTVDTDGTYDVDLTDANGCEATDAITVVYAAPAPIDLGSDVTICQGSTITLDATVPGATYLWTNGAGTSTITVGTAGNFGVTVTQGSCTVSDAIIISVAALPTVALGNDAILCLGEQIVLDATGPGLTYAWNTGAVSPTIIVSSGGTYDVTLTNAANCTATDAIDIVYASPSAIDLGADVVLCQGENVVFDATLPGSSYVWSSGASTPSITVSTFGAIWVEVTQGNCSVSDTVQVQVRPMPQASLGNDATLCAGEDIVLDATWPGATYLWNTGAVTPTLTVALTGTYSVDVDLNGCIASDAIDINVLSATSLNLGPDRTLCAGGQVVLDATTPGSSYAWSTGASSATITATTSGTYWAEVSTGLCSVSDTVVVTVNPMPQVALGNDATLCAGEDIVLDATWPGATYLWNTGAVTPTLTVALPGTYSVDVDLNGCIASDAIDINLLTPDAVDLGTSIVGCEGDAIILDATIAGASYLWNTGEVTATLDVIVTGTYWVDVSQSDCVASDTINVELNPIPQIDLGTDRTFCEGQTSTTLDATWPGATYDWNTGAGSPTLDVTTTGTYSVDVDLNGCVATDEVQVMFGSLSIDLGQDTTLCAGQTLQLAAPLASGTAMWNDVTLAATYTVTQEGTYWVVFTGGSGCDATDTIFVSYNDPGTVDLGPDLSLCEGQTHQLNATLAGAVLQWEDGSSDAVRTVSSSGMYSFEALVGQCVVGDAIAIDFSPLPSVDLGADIQICPGSEAVFDATTSDASYFWQNGSSEATLSVGTAGEVTVTVSVNGCSSSDEVLVSLLDGPTPDLGADVTICQGASLVLEATENGSTYVWDDASTLDMRMVQSTGSYWVDVSRNGCTARDTIRVTVFDPSVLELGADRTICAGSTTELDATVPGAEYVWSNGFAAPTISVGSAGTYGVTITVAGCTAEDAVQVAVLELVAPELGPDISICEGTTADLVVTDNGGSISWSTGGTGPAISVSNAGTYTVTIDSLGCSASDMVVVITRPVITEVDLGDDRSLCPGAYDVLEPTFIPGATYLWSTGATGPLLAISGPGTYSVTASGACISANASIVITAGDCDTYVFVPDAFTPNNDGMNDVFLPSLAGQVDRYELNIFDRWGERIATITDPAEGWDGSYSNVASQDGVYVWTLYYRVLSPTGVKAERITGHVTLLR